MKKILFSLAAVALLATSCSKDETTAVNDVPNPYAIGFDASTGKVLSRATATTLNGAGSTTSLQGDANGFGVYATKEGTSGQEEYIDDLAYGYDSGAWGWVGADQTWPDVTTQYPMNFYAYHPKSATTDLELSGSLLYEYDIAQNTSTTPQEDLLAANKLNVTTRPPSSNVTLNFQHILSQIIFKVVGGIGMTVEVQSIAVKAVGSVRTFNYAANPLAWAGSAPIENISYSYLSATDAIASITGDGTTAALVTGTEGSLMLIPQDFSSRKWTSWSATPATAPVQPVSGVGGVMEGGETYVEVVYRIYETGTTPQTNVIGYALAGDHPDDPSGAGDLYNYDENNPTKPLFIKVGYPLDTNWEMGKTYTYTINLGPLGSTGGRLIDDNFIAEDGARTDLPVVYPDSGEEIDVPEPIFNGTVIDFTVSVGDWEDATGISLQ
jgi:hypothetical protein